jgi:uncharacterized membrane-anchored protein YhcB (DUF1043 family)
MRMLVYCNNLVLNPPDGIDAIARCIATWVGRKSKEYVDPKALLGDARIRLKDGSRLSCISTLASGSPPLFPVLAATTLTHPDSDVPGRQWATEIGFRRAATDAPIECSIFLETREVGAGVNDPVQVTRPRIVEDMVESCAPSPNTPGLWIKELRTSNATTFFESAIDPQRKSTLIVVSPTYERKYLVDADRVRSLTIGLAQVFVIPEDEDTRILEDALTPKYAAYLGAVNIIFPVSRNRKFREAHRYVPDQIEDMLNNGRNPETEILSTVTHRLNLPQSWRRITSYTVADAKFRQQLGTIVQRAKESQQRKRQSHETELDQVRRELDEKSAELKDFLELANEEIGAKNSELNSMKDELSTSNEMLEALSEQVRELEAANEAMKFALQEKKPAQTPALAGDSAVRDAVAVSLGQGISSVEDMLRLVGGLYPERIVVLESAYKSAKASHTFRSPERALKLLLDLAGKYWEALSDGKGDGEARKVFGTSYAAREAEILSREALKRRTFKYGGSAVEMLKHLKIGVKDTVAETLRIHFEGLPMKGRLLLVTAVGI